MSNPPQPDLFATSFDGFSPLVGNGPRLWVRRLVIWSEAKEPAVRDIPLRPGLNIVWSPDSGAADQPMGHGGGKTSFCRLIRYCLGEDSFGTDAQRNRLAAAMPGALVGAEVMLDGQLWNVIRPIGAGASSASHCAIRGGSLDTLLQDEIPNPTMNPLRQAIAQAIMPTAWPNMPGSSSADEAWEVALAWMTRDQECRLLDIIEWRAPETQSHSPTRNMARTDRVRAIRLLIKALQQDEIDATRRAQAHRGKAEAATRSKLRVEQVREDVARSLAKKFGGAEDDQTSPNFWVSKAKAEASAAKHVADPQIDQKLSDARALVEQQDARLRAAEKQVSDADAALPEVIETLRIIDKQIPRLTSILQDATDPICTTCRQPWPDNKQEIVDDHRANLKELTDARNAADQRRKNLLADQSAGKQDAALARQQFDQAKATFERLEQNAKETAAALASATGYVTLTERYPEYLTEIARLDREIQGETEAEAKERRTAKESRQAAQAIVQRLSELFHMTVQFLIPDNAVGRVALTENDIKPDISLHGELTTAAVDSLKVVAFDIAALLLTLEGKTELPGFWLHDSPREADLGLEIYHRLFELVFWLEARTETPQFQYIVTTTTAPPEKLRGDPWRVLELSSAPSDRRLFRRDL